MRSTEKSMSSPSAGNSTKKQDYTAPVLTSFGMVRDLTATGSGEFVENSGADEKNNARRNKP